MPFLDFRTAILTMEQWGLTDVLLPFLLIFAIIFAIVTKSNILGDKKGIHVVFALAVALTVVIPHVMGLYPADMDAVAIINRIIPNISLVVVAVLAVLLLIGVFGGEPKAHHGATFAYIVIFAILFNIFFNERFPSVAPIVLWLTLIAAIWGVWGSHGGTGESFIPGWITVIVFIIVFFMVIGAMNLTKWPEWLEWMRDPVVQSIVIVLLIIFAVVGYITKKAD